MLAEGRQLVDVVLGDAVFWVCVGGVMVVGWEVWSEGGLIDW